MKMQQTEVYSTTKNASCTLKIESLKIWEISMESYEFVKVNLVHVQGSFKS